MHLNIIDFFHNPVHFILGITTYFMEINFEHDNRWSFVELLPSETLKIIFKKQSFKDSGNSPTWKQKMNKYQLNKTYENSVRKARV